MLLPLLFFPKKSIEKIFLLNNKTHLQMFRGFPDSSVGKESACNAGDPGSIPGSERSAGEGIGYTCQLAQRIPWTIQPMGSQRFGHN